MAYKDDGKFSAEDFVSYESIDDLFNTANEKHLETINDNDSNGYTPLCAAVLMNADPLMLLYLTKVVFVDGTYEDSVSYLFVEDNYNYLPERLRCTKNADVSRRCKKGKTPLQVAIMTGNILAIKILLCTHSIRIDIQEKVNKYKTTYYTKVLKYSNGLPVFIEDDKGNEVIECYGVNIKRASTEGDVTISPKDILNASSSTKADILSAISDYYKGIWYYSVKSFEGHENECRVFDDYGNTPIIMATRAQCYDSIDLILSIITSLDNVNIFDVISYTNSNNESAISIALDNNDQGAIDIFIKYSSTLNLLEYSFSNNKFDLINSLLLSKMYDAEYNESNILNWHDGDELILTYSVNDTCLLQYLNNNYNSLLQPDNPIYYFFNDIVNKISQLDATAKLQWISVLDNYSCYSFISHILSDDDVLSCIFSKQNYTDILTEFLLSNESIHSSSIYCWFGNSNESLLIKEY